MSDPTWLADFRSHRRSANANRRGQVLLAGDAVHLHSPAGGQGMNTGVIDAHNLGWKLALVAAGRAPDALLDSYGAGRSPVAGDVLKLTHALVRYGTMGYPVKRRVRDIVVPAVGRTPAVQRRAVRRLGRTYVACPARTDDQPGPGRGGPKPGQRMPDIGVLADGKATTVHRVLRHGRHVLVVPAALPAGLRHRHRSGEPAGAPRRHGAGRPGPAGRPRGGAGKPGILEPVTGYLREVFGKPPGS